MIAITELRHWYWRNPHADVPVTAARLAWQIDPRAAHPALPALLRGLAARVPGMAPPPVAVTPAQALEAIARGLQGWYDVAPDRVGLEGEEAGLFWAAWGDRSLAHMAVRRSVELVAETLASGDPAAPTERVLAALDRRAPGPSRRVLLREIARRGLPWRRRTGGGLEAGQGINARRFGAAMSESIGSFAFATARQKPQCLALLAAAFLPTGRFATARTRAEAERAAAQVGFPLVVKPVAGSLGREVFTGIGDAAALAPIAERFERAGEAMLLQSQFEGVDHRILVVGGRAVAVAQRRPPVVTGDGRASVSELIAALEDDPYRGPGHTRHLSNVVIDAHLHLTLERQGLTLDAVPEAGREVRLRETANVSAGGSAVDLTDTAHPDNLRLAERAATVAGIAICGVDLITTDIARSWRETGGGICELNTSPGMMPHVISNPGRDVAGPIAGNVMAGAGDGRIPTAMVTGTKGKTTTAKMLSRILAAAGHRVGMANSYGIFAGDDLLAEMDATGPGAAESVLADRSVSAAVLETARGGILRRGIGLDRCDVAALLNLGFEQVGIDGVETLEDMREVKRKVTDTATGRVVLNLDDALVAALVDDYGAGRVTLFSAGDPAREAGPMLQAGARLVRVAPGGGTIEIADASGARPVVALDEVPLTLGGRHAGHVANALAATALADGLGLAPETIAAGLRATPLPSDGDPGRTRFLARKPFTVVVEVADSPPAYRASRTAFPPREAGGARIAVFTVAGDRHAGQWAETAAMMARDFDRVLLYEDPAYMRGHAPGALAASMAADFAAAGAAPGAVEDCGDLGGAFARLGELLAPGDFALVVMSDEEEAARLFDRHVRGRVALPSG